MSRFPIDTHSKKTIALVTLFTIAMAFVESSVVVYLREIYYQDGFTFPLVSMKQELILVELLREAATIIMLGCIGVLSAKSFWQRFAYFLIAFGVWDIFYYIWLKALLNWPLTLFDWDILFLIPLPWIGPVIAPVIISLLMMICGWMILSLEQSSQRFRPTPLSYTLTIIGATCILFSFMRDTDATSRFQYPLVYWYCLLAVGLFLGAVGFSHAYIRSASRDNR